jgi:hypothetical protein
VKVEVIEMRHNGAKIQITDETRRYVGHLQIFPYTNPRTGGNKMMIAALFPRPDAFTEFVREELENATIGELKGDYFVIKGLQHMRRGKKIYASFPQAWLCRPIADAA